MDMKLKRLYILMTVTPRKLFVKEQIKAADSGTNNEVSNIQILVPSRLPQQKWYPKCRYDIVPPIGALNPTRTLIGPMPQLGFHES